MPRLELANEIDHRKRFGDLREQEKLDTKTHRYLLRPLIRRSDSLTDQTALVQAIGQLEYRVANEHLLNELRPLLKKGQEKREVVSWRNPERAMEFIMTVEILYGSRQLSTSEYIFFTCAPIEHIHDDRISKGVYKRDLGPIDRRMLAIKRKHGLTEDEWWELDEAPSEWRKLSNQWSAIANSKFIATLQEFGLESLAELKKRDPKKFDNLRERGRRAIFHTGEIEPILRDMVKRYEEDAVRAASAKAYASAVTALGTAVEGLLTLRCLASPLKARRLADSLPKRPRAGSSPTEWSFYVLIEVCLQADWLPPFETDWCMFDSARLAHLLRHMRNYVHPSMQARERPWSEVDERDYRDAKAIYAVLYQALGKRSVKKRRNAP